MNAKLRVAGMIALGALAGALVLGQDRGRRVGRPVVDDHPESGAHALVRHALEGASHVGRLVTAGADQQVAASVTRPVRRVLGARPEPRSGLAAAARTAPSSRLGW